MFNIQTVDMRTPLIVRRWAANVRSAGGGFENNSLPVASNLVRTLQARSYYPKIVYLMPFLGQGVAASVVPLIDKNGFGSPTNVNFVNADFSQSTGLQGNGSNKRLAMPFNFNQIGTSANGGCGFWSLNVSVASGTQYGMGAFGGVNTYGLRFGNSGGDINCQFYWGGSTLATLAELRSNSHYYGNRSSATSRILYKDGVSAATNTTSDSAAQIADNVVASYAVNAGGGSFLVFWGGAKGVEYYTDGTMTAEDVSDFHSVITNCLMKPTGRI